MEEILWKLLWEVEQLAPPLSMIPAASVFLYEEQSEHTPSLTATVEGVPALLISWDDVLGGGDIYAIASTHRATLEESGCEEARSAALEPHDLLCAS